MAKFRFGFVSNSSSSSFVVAFDRAELTEEYLAEKLFGKTVDEDENFIFNTIYDVDFINVGDIVKMIHNELAPVETLEDGLLEEFRGMSQWDDKRFPKYPDWTEDEKEMEERWNTFYAESDAAADVAYAEFMEKTKGMHLFIGEFHDDNMIGSMIDHGQVFRNVPHKRVSHH